MEGEASEATKGSKITCMFKSIAQKRCKYRKQRQFCETHQYVSKNAFLPPKKKQRKIPIPNITPIFNVNCIMRRPNSPMQSAFRGLETALAGLNLPFVFLIEYIYSILGSLVKFTHGSSLHWK